MGAQINDTLRGVLKLRYPLQRGVISSMSDMDLLWKYTFAELHANPKEVPLTSMRVSNPPHRTPALLEHPEGLALPAILRNLQLPCALLRRLRCPHLVCQWQNHGCSARLRRNCVIVRADLRRLLPPARREPHRPGRTRSYREFDHASAAIRLLLLNYGKRASDV